MSSRTNEGIVPTLEEIQAYKERPPILATIELVNGALLTEDLPVAPDLNVKKVTRYFKVIFCRVCIFVSLGKYAQCM